jgi:bifunctional UDP-N-acetylglucosamine pyrophosphorylase / glucosamine-1-phosphate N-acetyltransferase
VLGVNDREQLAAACSIMRGRINSRLMADGVSIADPSNTYIDHAVTIGRGTVVMPMVFVTGDSGIGEDCTIGPCTSINDTSVADGCTIQFSTVDGCEIMSGANIGPFSRLRPGCKLGPESKAGSFVEMKKTTVGRGSKVPHLSYMGDTTIGEEANVGAGSITCNYDGVNKFPTTIGDGAFIGSDTMLVAPVNVGKDAVTGAGSVISSDVPDGSLAIERTEQKIIPGYSKRRKKGKKDKGK